MKERKYKASINSDAGKIEFFREHFARRMLDSITRDEVDALLSNMKPATANRHVALLRAMMRAAHRE